ncbi:hypothetical protein QYM36_006233, partial [Artemia franciscana]
ANFLKIDTRVKYFGIGIKQGYQNKMSYRMSGWKYGAFIGGIVGFIGLALYPTVIYPMQHIDEYRMKVWSDPFGRKKSE